MEIRSGYAHNRDIELHYEDLGNEADPVVLLIMGLGAQLTLWHNEFCGKLVDRGYRVIRFDNRDVGLSSKLHGQKVDGGLVPGLLRSFVGLPSTSVYRLEDMAADAAAVLDHLGIDRAHVVGASMGGMIAQTMAIEHPERVLSLTSMMSRTGSRRDAFPGVRELAALMRTRPTNTLDSYLGGMETLAAVIGSPDFPTDKERLRQIAAVAYERGIYLDGTARQLHAINCQPKRDRDLARLDVPTVVLHGAADKLVFPRGGRATARAIPDAELRIYEGMGHDIPEQLWPRFVDEIDRVARRAGKDS